MTKAQMANRIKELEAELGIKTKPTKMQEIEALETEAMISIKDIIRNCETVTGRSLKAITPDCTNYLIEAKESSTPLRCMVEELRDFAMNSGNYDFDGEIAFADWVHSKLTN